MDDDVIAVFNELDSADLALMMNFAVNSDALARQQSHLQHTWPSGQPSTGLRISK